MNGYFTACHNIEYMANVPQEIWARGDILNDAAADFPSAKQNNPQNPYSYQNNVRTIDKPTTHSVPSPTDALG